MTARKWSLRLTIPLLVLAGVAGLVHWVLLRSLNEVIAYTVDQQTKGVYAFHAGHVHFSWIEKRVFLEKAVLRCRDTVGRQTFANVQIASLELRLESWRELLFDRKAGIERFELTGARLEWHDHRPKDTARKAPFHPSVILDDLRAALVHLRVRSFDASDVSFVLFKGRDIEPFEIRNIRFSVRNFEKINNADGHLFASDSVSFSLGPQVWRLPESRSQIAFSGLRFTGSRQHFEVDSLSYIGEGAQFAAAKAFFNSRHLPALYQKEELLLDTVRCVSPVLSLPLRARKNDTAKSASPFRKIHIGVIEVTDARLHLKGERATALRTDKTDLGVYGLTILPGAAHPVTTDSISLDLDDVVFLSKDSLSSLGVSRMIFRKNDVFLVGVNYAPVGRDDGLTFTAPLLHLKQIHLDELLKKRLVAHEAELASPVVTLKPSSKKKKTGPAGFYRVLGSLGDLISVPVFRVRDGQMQWHTDGDKPVDIRLTNFDTKILLQDFLEADSLIDIKHALPTLTIGQITARTPKLTLEMKGYQLNGLSRHNWLESVVAHLPNGTRAVASQVYWEAFDWDVLQKKKEIQINRLGIGDLGMTIHSNPSRKEKKRLPVIRITQASITRSRFSLESPQMKASWKAENLSLNHLRSEDTFFRWDTARARLLEIDVRNAEMQASVGRLDFDTHQPTRLEEVTFHNGAVAARIPELILVSPIHATDFQEIPIASIRIPGAQVSIRATEKKPGQARHKPLPSLHLQELDAGNVQVRYESKRDSVQTTAHIRVRNLRSGHETVQYDSVRLGLTGTTFRRHSLFVSVPAIQTWLRQGEISREAGIRTAAGAKWEGVSARWTKNDSVRLQLKEGEGSFADANLQMIPGKPVNWQAWVAKTRMRSGPLTFDTPKSVIGASGYSWSGNTFHLTDFHVSPRLSREETFRTVPWQADYQVIKGKALQITGISYSKGEEGVLVRKITAEEPDLMTSRDKNMPFRHGIEKLMPTRLIGRIGQNIAIDTLEVVRGKVTVHESVPGTTQWGMIPLENMHALILGITNRPGAGDSLRMLASLRLYGSHIRRFHYREAYGDSLSGFRVTSLLSRMSLPGFNPIVEKMASVEIRHGVSDTLYARWTGNKYAAFGVMYFYYNDLAARLLDRQHPERKRFVLQMESFLANSLVLRKKNRRPVYVFFERDREKFVFNYLVKAKLQGILSAIGVKSSRKFLQKYREVQQRHGFPDQSGEFVVERK